MPVTFFYFARLEINGFDVIRVHLPNRVASMKYISGYEIRII